MPKSYYIILGLSPDASLRDIKGAYRQMAKRHHPDHLGKDNRRFIDVQEADSVLSDASRRQAYDQILEESRVALSHRKAEPLTLKPKEAEPPIPSPPTPGAKDVSLTRCFETLSPSFDELFDRLWSNFTSLERPKAETVRSLCCFSSV